MTTENIEKLAAEIQAAYENGDCFIPLDKEFTSEINCYIEDLRELSKVNSLFYSTFKKGYYIIWTPKKWEE